MLRPIFFILFYLEIVCIFSCATIILVSANSNFFVNADRNYICVKVKALGLYKTLSSIKYKYWTYER